MFNKIKFHSWKIGEDCLVVTTNFPNYLSKIKKEWYSCKYLAKSRGCKKSCCCNCIDAIIVDFFLRFCEYYKLILQVLFPINKITTLLWGWLVVNVALYIFFVLKNRLCEFFPLALIFFCCRFIFKTLNKSCRKFNFESYHILVSNFFAVALLF